MIEYDKMAKYYLLYGSSVSYEKFMEIKQIYCKIDDKSLIALIIMSESLKEFMKRMEAK